MSQKLTAKVKLTEIRAISALSNRKPEVITQMCSVKKVLKIFSKLKRKIVVGKL